MDLPVRKKLPHTIPQWVSEGSWFFITINCVPRDKNQLCCADVGDAVLAAIRHNHEKLAWHCRLCLLMPDHLHAILAFPREPGMATMIKNWKKYVAGNTVSVGSATSSIIACATIMKWRRRRVIS
jgi:REP-associated tyrosine transposase